jgi:hypothetical protein
MWCFPFREQQGGLAAAEAQSALRAVRYFAYGPGIIRHLASLFFSDQGL